MYIWQQPQWPNFDWDSQALSEPLDRIKRLQGQLLGRAEGVPGEASLNAQLDALIENALRTSEIEGEILLESAVRSSALKQLGADQAGFQGQPTRQSDQLIQMLIQATRSPDQRLSVHTLCQWQALLFPDGSGVLGPILIGALRDDTPMQVVSGRLDRPTIHFEAPPKTQLISDLNRFIDWFNHPPRGLDGLLRAGVAHLWLVTLHPFRDGNGRISRAVADLALAQAEARSIRFYSMSAALMKHREAYYQMLETTQKGGLEITPWLSWFLEVLEEALNQALHRVGQVLTKASYWQRHAQTVLNERQIKVLARMLEGLGEAFPEGINSRIYQSIAGVSKAQANRDLMDLVSKGCLIKGPGEGKRTRYLLMLNQPSPDAHLAVTTPHRHPKE